MQQASHSENPSKDNWLKVKHVFRYIVCSCNKYIAYENSYKSELWECYTVADFGGCKASGRSTSGILILYSGGVHHGLIKGIQ